MKKDVKIFTTALIISLAYNCIAEDKTWKKLNSQLISYYVQGKYIQAAKSALVGLLY